MRIKAKDFEKTMAVTEYLDYFYALCSNTAPSEAIKDHVAQLAYLVENQIAPNCAEKPNILDGPEPTAYQPVKPFIIDNCTDCRFFLRGWRWTSTFLRPTSDKYATWNKFRRRKILDSYINRMNWEKSSLHGIAKRRRLIRPKARKANDFT
ncbi:hypothetical protein ACE4ZH_05430 [Enterococcus casseliflavus]|uniref:hypothetical protein n=1 Tax=Enterococcus casseliflavus TaxID=37734 RepID=UPI0035CB4956